MVVKYREYAKDKGDLIVRLRQEEYAALPRKGPLGEHGQAPPLVSFSFLSDPAKALPPELVFRIFDLVPATDRPTLDEITEGWRNVFAAYRMHRLKALSDHVAEGAKNALPPSGPAAAEVAMI